MGMSGLVHGWVRSSLNPGGIDVFIALAFEQSPTGWQTLLKCAERGTVSMCPNSARAVQMLRRDEFDACEANMVVPTKLEFEDYLHKFIRTHLGASTLGSIDSDLKFFQPPSCTPTFLKT